MTDLDSLDIYEEHEGLRAISPAKVLEIARARDEYKTWWERDSRSLSATLNELSLLRAVKEDQRAKIERLRAIESIALRVASSRRHGVVLDSDVLDKLDEVLEIHS